MILTESKIATRTEIVRIRDVDCANRFTSKEVTRVGSGCRWCVEHAEQDVIESHPEDGRGSVTLANAAFLVKGGRFSVYFYCNNKS